MTLASFIVQGKLPTPKPLLSSLCITSVKISEFAIFVGRSDSWQALELSRFKISYFISDFVISWDENRLSMFWLLIIMILGWFLYCSIIFRIGCPIRFSVWSLPNQHVQNLCKHVQNLLTGTYFSGAWSKFIINQSGILFSSTRSTIWWRKRISASFLRLLECLVSLL